MYNCLYLLCPTDCLESIINNTFKHESYFYTSLGNSFLFDSETIGHIKDVVKKYNIRKICFVLSADNKIILDALGNKDFSDIRGLKKFYNEIERQKKHSEVSWYTPNRQFSVLSYYMNKKIKELQLELSNFSDHSVRISGKVYNRHEGIFRNIHSDLICTKKYHLN